MNSEFLMDVLLMTVIGQDFNTNTTMNTPIGTLTKF